MGKRHLFDDELADMDRFRDGLRIDKLNLDDALVEQPELFFHVASQQVMASSRRDQAKEYSKRVDAGLFMRIRQEMIDEGERPTEITVNARVESHKDHTVERDAYLELMKEADLWLALKEAFMQRSYMLKDLASLHITNYYATSSVRGGDAREVQQQADTKRRQAISSKRKKLI